MKRTLLAALATAGVLLIATPASADDSSHTLTVDGVDYASTKVSGPAIHWETPDTDPTTAYFAERDQTWTGNGSEHLPCPAGIHWISNENVLTISHCLEEYTSSTTTSTTSLPDETTTTTTTSPSTTLAPTTTAAETTSSTSSPTISTAPSTTSSTTVLGTASTTSSPTSTAAPTTVSPTVTTANQMPKTGSDATGMTAAIATVLLGLGAMIVGAARRPS